MALTHPRDISDTAVEEPPYEVKESGWGEFEVRLLFVFVLIPEL